MSCFNVYTFLGDSMIKNILKNIRMQEYMLDKKSFSRVLDVPELQYGRYENYYNLPSLETALKISAKLNRTVNEIWFFEEQVQ